MSEGAVGSRRGQAAGPDSLPVLVDGVHRTWLTYIIWYTPFMVANAVAWTWFASGAGPMVHKDAICWLWIALDVADIITVAVIGSYAVQVHRHLQTQLTDPRGGHAELYIPSGLSNLAAAGNAFTLVVAIIAWLYLMFAG